MNQFTKNLEAVTDPSDWENTQLPSLDQLDSLQRCYICKEFLQAPVVTSCNHTFCSSCIREHLMTKSACPLCQSNQLESNLRRVVVLEEIVNCFASLRPHLLECLRLHPEVQKRNHDSMESSDTDIVVVSEEEVSKKPKLLDAECPVCQKTMDAKFLQSTHIDSCLNGKPIMPAKTTPKKSARKEISSFFKPAKPKDDLKLDHSDFYFNNPEKHIMKENRLPKLDFSSLSLPKLKERLTALQIPAGGSRHQLELRYNQYYILFNSNLDSSHPVDVRVLRLRLSKWESSHLAFTPNTSSLFTNNNSKSISSRSITDKKFLVKEWNTVYHHEFKVLKAQALRNIKHSEQKNLIAQAPDNPSGSNEEDDKLPIETSPFFVSND